MNQLRNEVYSRQELNRINDTLDDIADGGYEINQTDKSARITLLGEHGMKRTLEFPLRNLSKVQRWVIQGEKGNPPQPSKWVRR